MQEAAANNPGGMIAVMGLEIDRFQEICEQVKPVGSVEVANHNSPRQVILTGEREALKLASELAKKEGAKLIVPLKVSGPWHSRFMHSASQKMEEALAACQMQKPTIPVVSNVTGDFFKDQDEIRACLVQQIIRPVKWVASMERLIGEGHRIFVEVGPGRVLSGLMRDISKEVQVINVEKLDDLVKLRARGSDPSIPKAQCEK
jgi:[acyl-carrier-protein] S-malonyltransferase